MHKENKRKKFVIYCRLKKWIFFFVQVSAILCGDYTRIHTHIRTATALLWAAGIKEKEEEKEKNEEAFVKLIYWKGVAPAKKRIEIEKQEKRGSKQEQEERAHLSSAPAHSPPPLLCVLAWWPFC